MAELFQEIFDDAKIFESLDRLEKQLIETGDAGSDSAKEISRAFDEAREFITGFSEGLADAAKEVDATRKATEQARKENATWAKSVKDLIGNFQIGGQSLSQWAQQVKGFAGIVRDGSLATDGASKSMRIFSTALRATGIGLVIAAVASLIGYFTRFQSGVDAVNRVLSATTAVFDKMISGFSNFGSAIIKVFQGDFSGAISAAKQGVTDLTTGLVDAATEAYNLEQAFQDLRDTALRSSVETARQRAELEKLKAVAEDGTLSISKRIAAQRQAGQVEQEIANRAFAIAETDLKLKQRQLDRNEENARFIEEEAKAQQAFFEAKSARDAAQLSSEKALRELRKEAHEARKKQLEDERKALEALAKDLQKLRIAALGDSLDADLFQVNAKFDELAKVAQAGVDKLNEIEAKRGLSPAEIAQRKEFQDLAVKIEEQRLGALLDVITEFNEKEIAVEKEQDERKKALAEKDLERAIKAAENEKKLRDEQINLTEQQNEKFLLELAAKGVDEKKIQEARAELDVFIQAARLQNELEFQQNLLALTDKGNTDQVKQIEATIATIQAKISNLQIEPAKKKGKGIFGLLGIDDENAQQAIKDATAQIIGAINEISQARIDAAAAEVERIDGLIAKQEEAVKAEQEIAKEGLANNVALEKERLAELKKQREAAAKEEAKARRAQILLDSVQQLSSLITASANIFKSLSSLPFGLGVPIAIGIIGAMFGAFVAAKSRALKAAEAPKLRKGMKLQGRTHEEGGTPLTDSDGVVFAEAERGEWLIGTQPSKEHDTFLGRLNKGEFKGLDLNEMLQKPGQSRNPASEAAGRIRDIESRKAELSTDQHWRAMQAAYMAGSREIVQAIKEQPEILPMLGGYKRITKKGNITEIETVIPKV